MTRNLDLICSDLDSIRNDLRDNQCSTVCEAGRGDDWKDDKWSNNRAYIAACAGSAESGWCSTLAAIESIPMENRGSAPALTARETVLIDAILAAWPDDLL